MELIIDETIYFVVILCVLKILLDKEKEWERDRG